MAATRGSSGPPPRALHAGAGTAPWGARTRPALARSKRVHFVGGDAPMAHLRPHWPQKSGTHSSDAAHAFLGQTSVRHVTRGLPFGHCGVGAKGRDTVRKDETACRCSSVSRLHAGMRSMLLSPTHAYRDLGATPAAHLEGPHRHFAGKHRRRSRLERRLCACDDVCRVGHLHPGKRQGCGRRRQSAWRRIPFQPRSRRGATRRALAACSRRAHRQPGREVSGGL